MVVPDGVGAPTLVPALSPATSATLGKRHRTSIERAATVARLVRRWLPGRDLVLVADGGFAAVSLGHACQRVGITFVTRCRLDVALYDPPSPPPVHKRGRKPSKGPRQLALKDRLAAAATRWTRHTVAWYGGDQTSVAVASGTALWYRTGQTPLPLRWVLISAPSGGRRPFALCCTQPDTEPLAILSCYLSRWNIEVTFKELRAWLGAETQRGGTSATIQRSTPCLFGLFSLITLSAHALHPDHLPTRTAAWYPKAEPTFADALATVRRALWTAGNTRRRPADPDPALFPAHFFASLVETAAYAA